MRLPLLTLAALLAFAGPAAGAERPPGPADARPRLLPGDMQAAGFAATPGRWLIGARPDAASRRIAHSFGARGLMDDTGIYLVRTGRARAMAAALRAGGRYVFSEPDSRSRSAQFPSDPATGSQWGLGAIGATSVTPPPVSPTSPLLGIIESGFDTTHPESQGVGLSGSPDPVFDANLVLHGTAVASVAGAPANGVGISGVWPGMRMLVSTSGPSCSSTIDALGRAAEAGAKVLNMSYGFPGGSCFAHFIATQKLYGRGTLLVSAAGNEFQLGNPEDGRPASDPHVITVAAIAQDFSPADFSNANNAIDLTAPGAGVLAAVPPSLDEDGTQDGYLALDGTSFSAPMVAAGAAWVMQQRPSLHHTQLTDLIRTSVRDLGRRGWDRDFGFGLFDLPTALTARPASIDPLEPNDNVPWINGKYFDGADPPISRGRAARLSARVDQLEDPVDVYRVVLPGRTAIGVTIRPTFGDPDLAAYNGWAKTVYSRRGEITRSTRAGKRRDAIRFSNPYRRPLLSYIAVWPATLDAGYRISVGRVRYR